MSTKHQQRRAEKQAARKKASKEKLKKARRASAFAFAPTPQPGKKKSKSVYDIIDAAARAKGKRAAGEEPTELPSGSQLIQAISDMITVSVKMHSGIVLFNRLAAEGRFVPTPEQKELVEGYEKKLVEFAEDVNVVITLHEAGHTPEEYIEITLHIADVMHSLVLEYGDNIVAVSVSQRDIIEAYVLEHKPAEIDMYAYMTSLHEGRMDEIRALYATGHSKELLQDFKDQAELMKASDVDDLEALADPENLEAPMGGEADGPLLLEAPNDPVTQAAQ